MLGNLGNVDMDRGHIEQGQTHYEAALAIHREVGSRVVEGIALANLGWVHPHHGRMNEAREHYDLALAISREVANPVHEGVVLCYVGALEVDQGRMAQAEAHLDQALLVNRAVGNRCSEGVALGDLSTGQGRVGEATEALRQGEALLREIDNPFELANLFCIRARAEIAAGGLGLARATLAEAETIAARIGATPASGLVRQIIRVCESLA